MKRKGTNTLGKLQQQKKLSVVMLMQLQLLELELLSNGKNNADVAEKYSDTKGREVFVPLQDIHTDTKRFQNRDEEYSAESVNRLINAVQTGDFAWELLDAVLLWKEPKTSKLFVLSGHSRFEAFKKLARKNTAYKGRGFSKIPAKIIEVSESEAIRIARESNNLSTKETDTARAKYYRELREKGQISDKQIVEKAKELEGKNAPYILNLSFLNPKGEIMDLLRETEQGSDGSENANIIRTIADWTGDIRKSYPDLTNSHENEITKYLMNGGYGKGAGKFSSKNDFKKMLQKSINRLYEMGVFQDNKPLNIKNTIGKGEVAANFDEEANHLRMLLDNAQKAFLDKTYEVKQAVQENKISDKRGKEILAQYEADYLRSKERYYDLINRKQDILKADKSQSALFGMRKKKNNKKKKINRIKRTARKIGEIPKNIADIIGYINAPIYLEKGNDGYGIRHIIKNHQDVLDNAVMTAEEFVRYVVANYNEIRQGKKEGRIVLVKRNGQSKVAILEIQPKNNEKAYNVITAYTADIDYLEKLNLLWK